jgi:hypothetical protein
MDLTELGGDAQKTPGGSGRRGFRQDDFGYRFHLVSDYTRWARLVQNRKLELSGPKVMIDVN